MIRDAAPRARPYAVTQLARHPCCRAVAGQPGRIVPNQVERRRQNRTPQVNSATAPHGLRRGATQIARTAAPSVLVTESTFLTRITNALTVKHGWSLIAVPVVTQVSS